MLYSKVIGTGQAGTTLAKNFLRELKGSKGFATNMAQDNLSLFDVKDVFALGVSGTGNDPDFGEAKALSNIEKYRDFLFGVRRYPNNEVLEPRITEDDKEIVIFTGGGGGSGNGITRVLVNLFVEYKKKVLVVIVIPRRSEGVKMKNNTLRLINWFIQNIFQKEVPGVSVALSDNQMLFDSLGTGTSLYEKINTGIIEPFCVLEQFISKHYDFGSGNNQNIDENDIKRVLFDKSGGFMDFRRVRINYSESNSEVVVDSKTESMYCSNFDINTASNFFLAIILPKSKDRKKMTQVAEATIEQVKLKAKTPNCFSSYFFSSTVTEPIGYMIVSGLRKSKAIDKLVENVKSDFEILQTKTKSAFEELEISEIDI